MPEHETLSELELAILNFESRWTHSDGSKRQAVEKEFGVHAATYYRWRAALVERPEALAHAPVVVRRLRRRPRRG